MNRKGFTLVELVATIALLAVLAIISFVSINGVINQSKVSNCNDLVNNVKSAVKEYISDNRYNIQFEALDGVDLLDEYEIQVDGNGKYIEMDTIEKLISGNYLSSPIINPFNNAPIEPTDIIVTVYLNDDYTVRTKDLSDGDKEPLKIKTKYIENGTEKIRTVKCDEKKW